MLPSVTLVLWPQKLAVVRLAPTAQLPTTWNQIGDFWSVVHTRDEISLVCDQNAVPQDLISERGWRIFKVNGPLPFETVGVLASIAQPLASAGISMFALSTYDTDYLLIKEERVNQAIEIWQRAGHTVIV